MYKAKFRENDIFPHVHAIQGQTGLLRLSSPFINNIFLKSHLNSEWCNFKLKFGSLDHATHYQQGIASSYSTYVLVTVSSFILMQGNQFLFDIV
jgi:hypothetical protein